MIVVSPKPMPVERQKAALDIQVAERGTPRNTVSGSITAKGSIATVRIDKTEKGGGP